MVELNFWVVYPFVLLEPVPSSLQLEPYVFGQRGYCKLYVRCIHTFYKHTRTYLERPQIKTLGLRRTEDFVLFKKLADVQTN